MPTAKASQTNGLRKFGHIAIWFGMGAIQYRTHTRPTWIAGNRPAHMTAKIVMASAKRLMLVRHFCRNRNRIAEISVPACPIPIQKTKLTIAKPQPTGLFTPHTPTPLSTRYPIIATRTTSSVEEMLKAMYQARGGRGASQTAATASVTEPKSCPPVISAAR